MNIFFVHQNPVIAAQSLCNAHVRSQIREAVDMLSTAHYLVGEHTEEMRSPTHKYHPSTRWVTQKDNNYTWLYKHYKALCEEYLFRHGVPHRLSSYLDVLAPRPYDIASTYGRDPSVPPAVVADDLKPKHTDGVLIEKPSWREVIEAYRAYYNRDKRHLFYWLHRDRPDWIT